MISLARQSMETAFASFCEELFRLPEIESIKARTVTVLRDNLREAAKEAVTVSYHDCFSDIDMGICVCLPADGSVTPEEYMRRIDRLTKEFYPEYRDNREDFFAIWNWYDKNR